MTINTPNAAAPATTTFEDDMDFAMSALSDSGIELVAASAGELLVGIDDPDVAAQSFHEAGRVIEEHAGLKRHIFYVDDRAFHNAVSKTVSAFLSAAGDDLTVNEADQFATESLLAAGIWPNSWERLMDEEKREALINRIIAERDANAEVRN